MPLNLPVHPARDAPPLPQSWDGDWISPVEPADVGSDRPAYVLERRFTLPDPPTEAWLFATALGVYEAVINGVRVGDHELAPGCTSYDRTLYAQSFAVDSLLRAGENVIEFVLSDGWYRGRNGSTQDQDCWGHITGALVQLEISFADGGRALIVSDAEWTSRESQIVRADLMRGQTTDFSRAVGEGSPVRVGVVGDVPMPTASPAPPVRRLNELPVVKLTAEREGISIADFGQNFSGWVRLTDLGAPGDETMLEFGEHLDPGGRFTTEHLDTHTPRGDHIVFHQMDRVIAGGEATEFEPRHTLHGFRYVRVTHPGRVLAPASLTAVVVHSDLARTGWFDCSDDRISRLHDAGVWTFLGNAVDVPTDCPTRERVGWTGDFQIFAPVAATLFDINGFGRKWLQAVRDDQFDNGCLAMFSPDPLRMRNSESPDRIGGGSAGWGDAAIAVPWTLYRQYGDPSILEDSWASANAWVQYALGCARSFRHPSRIERSENPLPHEEYIWDGPFHFGEWLEPQPHGEAERDPAGKLRALFAADQGEIGTAYLFRSLKQLSNAATVIGRAEEAGRLAALAERVQHAWREEFLMRGGHTMMDTQAAYVRAIAFGLIPSDQVEDAADRLVALIADNDERLGTGFLSTGSLLPVLADTGHSELAHRLLVRDGSPSWLEMLNRGATTFWENWENVDASGFVRDGSLNHYSKGAVVGFLYSHIVGLRQHDDSAGWRSFRIQPDFAGGLEHASATMQIPAGEVSVSWYRAANVITLTASIPSGVEAELFLPNGQRQQLAPGTTTTVRAAAPCD
ncbi:MAG: family 78 glycoside hydrolase catalytic domain [Rhodococcus sp. (in: high G+C Gram-positive bacteria)]